MILNIARCPECGSTSFAVEVRSWVNIEAAEDHTNDYPHFDSSTAEFDPSDAEAAEPIEGGDIICQDCHTVFKDVAPEPAPVQED